MKLLLLSSSRGTTMQAVLDSLADGSLNMECIGLISDEEHRGCVQKALDADIPVTILSRAGHTREEYDQLLHDTIVHAGGSPENTLIAALGWMFILSPWFVQQWPRNIINVHPSLLPAYPGAHAIADALKAGDTKSGMTIHFIDEGVDTGEIIVQKSCTVEAGETEESLKEKIQELEKEWVPKVLVGLQKNPPM